MRVLAHFLFFYNISKNVNLVFAKRLKFLKEFTLIGPIFKKIHSDRSYFLKEFTLMVLFLKEFTLIGPIFKRIHFDRSYF